MTVTKSEIRAGAYYDSIVLMQLQSGLASLPGVNDAGAVMATAANLEILDASGLKTAEAAAAGANDLVIAVAAESDEAADEALAAIDGLLARRRPVAGGAYRPKSLRTALELAPDAAWVLISIPGQHAARVARRALADGRNVFLYSDNVAVEEEVELKREAHRRGLLVMGPDCGTAIVGGAGLGFANRVRRGAVGLVGASGTGLQAITSRIHAAGGGVSHALGTGGRDLSAAVGGATALQAVDLLRRDPETRVIVLVSKPPDPAVARQLLAAARGCGKPVVVDFIGHPPPARRLGPLHFAASLADAADLAVELIASDPLPAPRPPVAGDLRGLFSGGTLAQEALLGLATGLSPLASNLAADGVRRVSGTERSRGHVLLDLGADELTVGRLHPMIDPELRLRRLRQEAADPQTAVVLLDLVLGDGAHADPAAGLAEAIRAIRTERAIEFGVIIVGTDEDPQVEEEQRIQLTEAGAELFADTTSAAAWALGRLAPPSEPLQPTVSLEALAAPLSAINVGLEIFHDSLEEQGASSLQVEWRPPAGGDARLAAILERMESDA